MISIMLISAGLSYFLSLPFASVLQGSGYRLRGLLRAKKGLIACLIYFAISLAAELCVLLLLGGVAQKIVTFFVYISTGLFVCLIHKKIGIKMHYTRRLVRLLIASTLLYIAAYIGLFFTSVRGLWSVTPATAPLVLAVTGFLMNPFENINNQRYVKRAKSKLAAATGIKIGVTGSYAKTSVKCYLEKLLSLRYKTLASPANYNTPMGVVKTVEEATGKEDALIFEMGARRNGDIRELCEMIHPDIGVITGIAPQHLETFGSIEAVMKEKNRLAECIPADKTVFYNLTDPLVRRLYEAREGKKIGVGYRDADYIISDRHFTAAGSSFTLSKGEKSISIVMPCVGLACVIDLSLAAAVAIELGVPRESVALAAKTAYSPSHRFEVVKSGAVTVIDDSYNINPIGAEVALDSLDLFEGGRKVVYTSGIVELGKEEEEYNRALGERIAKTASIAVVCKGRYGDAVVRGISGATREVAVIRVENTQEASSLFGSILKKGDVLLIMSDLPRDYLL